MTALAIAAGSIVGAIVGVATWMGCASRPWLRRRCARAVVVHTTDDRSVEGVLAAVGSDGLVLRAARYLDTDTAVALAGEVFVPSARVAFVQLTGRRDVSGV